ncbi:23S rRNA pseudouridine2604 synthase [Duganella sp. 1411]|jgi:23S rRNA pseudouridine2604 synthase|uniref:rRNA pseudouridine synthase n=1 Tax=Duganella sp. 1411 TaxID=2806572 RepID=UPI001AE664B1|nr:rRNA pseudouridine synthase [Duganella sp. 1411]MBP1203907.1 23S rRNA pseudouridine2604 synthase [Duganella sp. 1411]
MTDSTTDNSLRLAKRLAEILPCSRREAELYIEGGYVSVDGTLVEEAGARVTPEQKIELAPDATLLEIVPVTILLHKPAGANGGVGKDGSPAAHLLNAESLTRSAPGQRFLKRHLVNLTLTTPLETKASGLLVFTQDFRVSRKLVDEAAKIEQEIIVEVSGKIMENGLALLNHGLPFNGKPLAPNKVSWQNENRLRFAVKNPKPGQIEHVCKLVGLSVVSMKRIRVGRIAMASLPLGEWRYLQDHERF